MANVQIGLVTSAQWLIAIGSFGTWLWSLFRIKRLTTKQRFMWQMYTGYGVILAVGTVIDIAGFFNENLQIRKFTPFAIFSGAMLVQGIQLLWPQLVDWALMAAYGGHHCHVDVPRVSLLGGSGVPRRPRDVAVLGQLGQQAGAFDDEWEVRKALRKTMFKYQLHYGWELFDKAYGDIRKYY